MIAYTYKNIFPHTLGGNLLSIGFILSAKDGDIVEEVSWNSSVSEQDDLEADYEQICETIAARDELRNMLATRIEERQRRGAPVAPPPPQSILTESQTRALWMDQVDNTIAAIQAKYTRFQLGYVEREAATRVYVDSNFSTEPSTWITRFADNVGMPYPAAANLILSQANTLRGGIKELEDLRMDKYLIARASDLSAAATVFNRIITDAYAIGARL